MSDIQSFRQAVEAFIAARFTLAGAILMIAAPIIGFLIGIGSAVSVLTIRGEFPVLDSPDESFTSYLTDFTPPIVAGLVTPRSGLAIHHGLTMLNAPGLIDSGYRGEVKVLMVNTDRYVAVKLTRGDRIAQLVVTPIVRTTLQVVDTFTQSARGAGGFGHTGTR